MYLKNLVVRAWHWMLLFWFRVFGAKYKPSACGHTVRRVEKVIIFNEEGLGFLGKDDIYCQQCAASMAIICGWCKKPIYVGDAITLFCPGNAFFIVPLHAKIYCENPLQLVACAATIVDRMGFWVVPGKVSRLSPMLEILASPTQFLSSEIDEKLHNRNGRMSHWIIKNSPKRRLLAP